jgi:hypothetical protein
VGYGISVVPQNRREDEDGVGHVMRSSSLLRLKASGDMVSQSDLKTSRNMTWMVHMTSSRRSCADKTKDDWVDTKGCIGLFYPNFTVFIALGIKGNLVF